jgi:hypothetical protein
MSRREASDAAESIRAMLDVAVDTRVIDLTPAAEALLLDLLDALEQEISGEIDVRGVYVAVAAG